MNNQDRNLRNLRTFNRLAYYNYDNLCSFNLSCPFKGRNNIINSCKGCQKIDEYRYYVNNLSCKELVKFRKNIDPSIL